MTTLHPYIDALAKKTGLPLELSPGGSFMALIDKKRLLISVPDNSDAILFYLEVGRPTLFRRGEVLAALMGGNLFLAETRGAALSYDEPSEMVGLNLLLPLRHLESEEFINAVDNFLAAGEGWGLKLKTLNAKAEERARQAGGNISESAGETETPAPGVSHMLRV